MQHFRPHAVHYRKCNVRPVLRWIYMNAERTFAKRRVHDFNDCVRHRARIRVGRYNGGKGFLYFLSIAFVWTCFILGCALLVGGRGGMREVIGAAGECAGNDDRGFDAPQRQFAGILYRHRIHARLRGKVGREIRGRSTRRTAAGHPDEQPLALFSHLGQRYAVYPLGAEHVDVVEFSQLLRRETPLLAGRDLTWHDDKNTPRVAVVNRLFASRMFGSATNALGGYYKVDDGTRIQVVGVVEDGKYSPNITEDPRPAMFLPILQSPSTETWLAVRSTGNPHQLAAAIRSKLRDLDAGLPTFVQTWNQAMDGALFPSRIAAVSLGILGVMGSILSVTGIFGLAAYSVSKRLRELGIRMALGAQRKEVLQAALGRALKLLAFGSAAGLLLGILASRVLAFIVYQATPRDPLVLAGTVLAMSLLGLVATWIPAQRALSIDPAILLREE